MRVNILLARRLLFLPCCLKQRKFLMSKILTRSFRVNSCFFWFTVQTCRARVITKVAKIVWRVTITDLFLSPGRVRNLEKFVKLCLAAGLAIVLMWNIQSPHDDLSSCESYKIITSKALGTMYAQHSLIAGTFGKDRSTTMNDFQ